MSALDSKVGHKLCATLIRSLSGLPGYPFHPEGESRLENILAEHCISVPHARATVARFDERCPTPADLRNAAFDLRAQFEPPSPSQLEKWAAENRAQDPNWQPQRPGSVVEMFAEAARAKAGGLQDAVPCDRPGCWCHQPGGANAHRQTDDQMWRAIKQHLKIASFIQAKNGDVARARRDLGFPLTLWDRQVLEALGEPLTKPVVIPMPTPVRVIHDGKAAAANDPPILEREEPPRCSLCSGTGYLDQAYCSCVMGKDLERVERGSLPA